MRTKYKYIHFVEIHPLPTRKAAYMCIKNKPEEPDLGIVKWYPPLRCYRFIPEPFSYFTRSNLDDIAHFMGQLKELI